MSLASTTIKVANQLNATLKIGDAKTWAGDFVNPPKDVEAGKSEQISHNGYPVSEAGVAYRAKKEDGSEWNWIFAWRYEVGTSVKIYNALRGSGKVDWASVREHLQIANALPVSIPGLKADLQLDAPPVAGSADLTATISFGG